MCKSLLQGLDKKRQKKRLIKTAKNKAPITKRVLRWAYINIQTLGVLLLNVWNPSPFYRETTNKN